MSDWAPERKTQLTNHQRQRKAIDLWRRRYESGPNHFGTSARGGHGPVDCPHKVVRWESVPHPKYGKTSPTPAYRAVIYDLTGRHDCVPGAVAR